MKFSIVASVGPPSDEDGKLQVGGSRRAELEGQGRDVVGGFAIGARGPHRACGSGLSQGRDGGVRSKRYLNEGHRDVGRIRGASFTLRLLAFLYAL